MGNFTNPKTRAEAETSEPDASTDLAVTIAAAVAAAMGPVLTQIQQANAQQQAATMDAMSALISGQQSGNADALKAARGSKRPESFLGDFAYPGTSHWAPNGEKLLPLTCDTFLGYHEVDENTGNLSIIPGYQSIADEHGGCTAEERTLLNAIVAGNYIATRRDGLSGEVMVQVRYDTSGNPFRKVIAVPKTWLTAQMKNMIGGADFLRQLQPETAKRAARPEVAA